MPPRFTMLQNVPRFFLFKFSSNKLCLTLAPCFNVLTPTQPLTRLLSPISDAASVEAGADVVGGAMPVRVPQLLTRRDESHISP